MSCIDSVWLVPPVDLTRALFALLCGISLAAPTTRADVQRTCDLSGSGRFPALGTDRGRGVRTSRGSSSLSCGGGGTVTVGGSSTSDAYGSTAMKVPSEPVVG